MQVNKMIRCVIVAAGAGVIAPAFAQEPVAGPYLGAAIMEGTLEIDGVSGDANPTALFIRGGYQFNPYIAAEARLGTGLDSDKFHDIKTEIEDFIGVYAKAGLPTTIGLYPYVALGYTKGELKASGRGFSSKDDESDVSLGIGVDYAFDRNFSIGLEYMKYIDTSDYEVSGLSLGANYRF
jgi:opacity protein-like surface antigen